jgi:protein-disulfide isomerase
MNSIGKTIARRLLAVAAFLATAAVASAAGNYTVFKDDRSMGDPKAPIVMIEYGAPACPHCAHFATTVLPGIKKQYIDSGKVLYVFRVYPIMPADGAVAGMAKCAKPGQYFPFLETAFKHQELWDPEYGIEDVRGGLVKLGGLAGMTPQEVERCSADKNELDRINRIAQDGYEKYAIKSVPFFVVNGETMNVTQAGAAQLQQRFDALLAKQP